MHIGTIKITASGSTQHSYSAASTRKASRIATGNTSSAALPCVACWKLRSVHSKVMPLGSTGAAMSAILPIACAEDSLVGSASPMKSAAG